MSNHLQTTRRLTRVARQALSDSPSVLAHFALGAIPFVDLSLWTIALTLAIVPVLGLGITAGYHRCFAHRAFETSRAMRFLLAVMGCLALQKGPLWWVIYHRLHHRHADEPADPHSPVVGGFWHAHCGWLFSRDHTHPDQSLVRDLAKYPELVWLDRLWMTPGLLFAGACYALLGWAGVVAYCGAVVVTLHVTFSINSVAHLFGRRRFETSEASRNNAVLGVLALGEGWHNNHHRAPYSARHGFAWYELDLTYVFIRLLAWARLVWDVKLPPPGLLVGKEQEAAATPADPPSAAA